jgi:PAS domain S-box-containing protein
MKEKNKIVGIQAIMRDITESKKSEEALQESEERLRNLFESSREGIIITGPEGRITRINNAAAAMLGYDQSELVGVSAVELYMNPKTREMMFKKLMEKSYVEKYELMAKKKDGSPIHVIASNLTRLDKEGNVLQTEAFFTDITERKKAEVTLKESEERFRGAIESSSDIMGIADLNGNIVMVNRAFERVIGFKIDEIVGKPFSTIQPGDQVSVASKAFGTIMREGSINNFEQDFMTKKGKRITTLASGTLLRDALGKPKEVFLVARDITERKKTYRRLESLNEKLEVVGELTRHDVNNKLATVMGNVYLVKQELADDHQALKHLSEIELSVGQAKLIFEFARFYEMLGIETLEYVRVEDAFKGACKQFSDLRVTVVNDYGGLRVLADSLLSRLFYNLIDNSLKHGEKITKIRVYYEEFGDNLHLVYEDDGVGIPQAEKEKIFEQGYGLYTGYGLYLIRKMCEAYGWTIKETGQPKKGAKFTMILPQTNVYEGKTSYRLPK